MRHQSPPVRNRFTQERLGKELDDKLGAVLPKGAATLP